MNFIFQTCTYKVLFCLAYHTQLYENILTKFSRLLKLPDLDLFTSIISLVTCTNQEYKMHSVDYELCVLDL